MHGTTITSGKTLIHRLPAWFKFCFLLALVFSTALLPRTRAMWLGWPALALLVIMVIGKLPLWPLLKRLILLEPFVVGASLLALFSGAPDRLSLFTFLDRKSTRLNSSH